MAAKRLLSSVSSVSKTTLPALSARLLNTTISVLSSSNSTGFLLKQELNTNSWLSLFKLYMVKPHPISLDSFLAVLFFALVSAQITVSFSQYLKLHLEQTRAPLTELFPCLLQDFGTRSLRSLETVAPLDLLNKNWKRFYLKNIFNAFLFIFNFKV